MICARCSEPAVTKTRGEHFCVQCYTNFISRKFRAEMGVFRVGARRERPHLLVFVSFGTSSLAMVDLLISTHAHQREKHNGMQGFDYTCVHIGDNSEFAWPFDVELKRLHAPHLRIQLPSRSSQHDIDSVLIRNLATSLARQQNSVAVLGYSMTKLSELTLAETVKGRGAAVPRLVSPDVVEDRTLYPLRDITVAELQEYARIRQLKPLPEPPIPGITQRQSIDEITRLYFEQMQKDFPSVVSTVAKVAARLSQPAEPCGLCQQDGTLQLCYACQSSLAQHELDKKIDILSEYEL